MSMYFISGIMSLSIMKNGNRLLSCLLSLEGLMLVILMLEILMSSFGVMSYCGLMCFSYVSVSEGAMGLGVMVTLIRGVGSDMFYYHSFI